MALFGSGKKDSRPVDEGLAQLLGSDEPTAIEFWKKRFKMTASVPTDAARVGALTPQIRELTRVVNPEERKRLTRARMIAFAQLPPEERQIIAAARSKAFEVDPAVLGEDQKLVDQLLPTLDPNIRAAYPSGHAPS
jgi:hypothetical protein